VKSLADLHLHSKVSDGINTPSELVAMAVKKELGGIALTDHDTLDGLSEFMGTNAPAWLTRVPGVEISTVYRERETHILGYFVP
jgi:predicted metal-dependent phosphoesterase TrpH